MFTCSPFSKEIKKIFNNKRRQYMNEKKRKIFVKSRQEAPNYVNKWKYFGALYFLKQKCPPPPKGHVIGIPEVINFSWVQLLSQFMFYTPALCPDAQTWCSDAQYSVDFTAQAVVCTHAHTLHSEKAHALAQCPQLLWAKQACLQIMIWYINGVYCYKLTDFKILFPAYSLVCSLCHPTLCSFSTCLWPPRMGRTVTL